MGSSLRILSAFFIIACLSAPFAQSLSAIKKLNVAVMTLKSGSGMSAEEADLICDRLRGELFNTGKVNVMEREQMQTILKEQGFQQSGACTDAACMVEVGQMLGVEKLVTGSIGKLGNLFMINLRVIDVKSGQITRVVSRDVKGAIEDVVTNLGSIAAELVDGTANKTQTIIGYNNPPPKAEPVAVEEKKEPAVTTTKLESEPVAVIDEREELNRNRGGMQMGFGMMFGRMQSKYTNTFDDGINTFALDTTLLAPLVIKTASLKFMIKAGPILTVDIGSGFSWGTEATDSSTSFASRRKDEIFYGMIPITFGLSFTKRFYPLKINVGIIGDYNFMWANYPAVNRWPDSLTVQFGSGWSIGTKAGLEFMLGTHVGISADFIWKYQLETTNADYKINDANGNWLYDNNVQRVFVMPPIGFNAGFNVYF